MFLALTGPMATRQEGMDALGLLPSPTGGGPLTELGLPPGLGLPAVGQLLAHGAPVRTPGSGLRRG